MNNTNTVIDEDDSGKVRYKDLRCGDMFEYGKNSDFYMKTSEGRLHLATGIVEHMDPQQPAGRSIYRSRTAASGAPSGSHGHSRYGGGGDLQ